MKRPDSKRVLLALAVASLVAGCSQSNQVKSMEAKMDEYEKIEDRVNKRAQQRIDIAPDWYLNAKDNEYADITAGVYGVASHYSKDMEIAFDDATSLAIGNAVRKSKMTISMLKQSARANAGEDQRNVFNRIQEELVKRVSVRGYKVVERDIRTEKGGYRAFVKVFIPTAGLFAENERKLIKEQIETLRQTIKIDDKSSEEEKQAIERSKNLSEPDLTANVNNENVADVEVLPLPPLSEGDKFTQQ